MSISDPTPAALEKVSQDYRKRGRASYIVLEVRSVRERYRERERKREGEIDGSDVTIVALILAMSLHSLLPKIRTIGDEFTLSFAKNLHFLFLPSHLPSLPSKIVIFVALAFATSSHFPLPKISPSPKQTIELRSAPSFLSWKK